MIAELIPLFERDLKKLKEELMQYHDESVIWKTSPGITNSAGNLTLHLIGNLNHFIGSVLGNTGFVRNREAEFEDKNIPFAKLQSDLDKTISMIKQVLGGINESVTPDTYPVEVFGKPIKTGSFLIHLYGHLNYHLGQVNYHRRLLS